MIDGHHSGEVPPPAGSGAGHVVAAMRSAADALTGLCPGELPDAALSELLLDLDAEWNVLARWRAFFDTDGEEARAARQHEQRSWHVSPLLDGAWRGDANFTTEAGEVIRNAVDRRARALYRAEKAAADANGEKVRSTARNAATTPSSSSSSRPPRRATKATASTSPPSPPSSTSPDSPTPRRVRSSARPKPAPP
jgi:hypothetical protein